MNYPTAGNSGPPGQGLNHAAPPSAGRAHPSQRDEQPLSFGSSLPRPVALNHAVHTSGRWGLHMHEKTAPSEHAGSPGPSSRLLLYTSSRQISSAYFGGDLSLAAVQHSIAFGGYSGFGHFPSSEPFPRTARQQRFTILAKYALRYSC